MEEQGIDKFIPEIYEIFSSLGKPNIPGFTRYCVFFIDSSSDQKLLGVMSKLIEFDKTQEEPIMQFTEKNLKNAKKYVSWIDD